jgi:hypothetical protein
MVAWPYVDKLDLITPHFKDSISLQISKALYKPYYNSTISIANTYYLITPLSFLRSGAVITHASKIVHIQYVRVYRHAN